MTHISTRLRAMAGQIPGTEDCYEAADYIERLEEALQEIANLKNYDDDGTWCGASYPDEIARVTLENKNV